MSAPEGHGQIPATWVGEMTERTHTLRRDVDAIQQEMRQGLQDLRQDLQTLRGQIWYIAVAALIGPTIALIVGRIWG